MSRRFLLLNLTICLAIFVSLFWLNLRLVDLSPRDLHFASYWIGTRAFLFDGQSPYTDTVTQQIQRQVLGRQAQTGEFSFAATYPLYATLLFAPFALIGDYTLARAVWMTALELALLVTLYFNLRVTRWQPPVWLLWGGAFFALIWVHGFLPLVNGDVVIVASLMFALALYAVRIERYELAGILLAFTSLQMLPLLLAVALLLIWSIARRQGVLVVYFIGTLALLTAIWMFFQPNWPVEYVRALLHYPVYPSPNTLGDVLSHWWPGVGRQISWLMAGMAGFVLLVEWWMALRRDCHALLWTCCLTLVLQVGVGLPTSPMTYTLLILPLALVFAAWEERAPLAGRVLAILALIMLGGGLWAIWLREGAVPWPQMSPDLFLPVPFVLLILLYWVRWWVVHARKSYRQLIPVE